ncbi:g10504 [Coccomyxa elongata]
MLSCRAHPSGIVSTPSNVLALSFQGQLNTRNQVFLHDHCFAFLNRCGGEVGSEPGTSSSFFGRRCGLGRAQFARAYAQRRRPVEDDVELDDGDFDEDREGFGLGIFVGQAWSALLSITDRLTDVVYDYVPADVSRSTVSLAVKAGLLLVLIGFARSILGFLLTVGTVMLGLFVASRVLGIEADSSAARPQGKKKGGRWGSGRWK